MPRTHRLEEGLLPLWRDAVALWALVRDSAVAWSDDRAPRNGAALAYYMAFSMAPILIIATAIAGMFFGDAAAEGQIFIQAKDLLGASDARLVQAMIASASHTGRGAWPAVVGVLTIVIAATSALAELKDDLDQIWHAPAARDCGFWCHLWEFAQTRLLSIGIILTLGFLLLISLALSALLGVLARMLGVSDTTDASLQALDFLVSFALLTALCATIYKVLASVQLAWRDVTVGAVVTALLFTAGRHVIGLYFVSSAITSMYGAAGALLVVLIWVYYSALILLYGAEFTKLYTCRFGSLRRARRASAQRKP